MGETDGGQLQMKHDIKCILKCCTSDTNCTECALLGYGDCITPMTQEALERIEYLEREVNDYRAMLGLEHNGKREDFKPTLFYDKDVEEMVGIVYNRCIETDCSECRHQGEIDDEVCMSDLIMELWRRLHNEHVMLMSEADRNVLKHGRWIEERSQFADIKWCRCSVCGHHLHLYTEIEAKGMYNYCMNCGAKMDEVSE